MAMTGTVVLRIVAAVMILLGAGGLSASLVVFQEAQGQLAVIDSVVKDVANTATATAKGVTSSTSTSLNQGIGSVVTMLDTTAAGIVQTGRALGDMKTSIDTIEKETPVLVHSAAETLETAVRGIEVTAGDLAQVEQQLGVLKTSMELPTVETLLGEQKSLLSSQTVAMNGYDLINSAEFLSSRTGIPKEAFESQGERMLAYNQAFAFNLGDLKVTGADLIELSKLSESLLLVDASQLKQIGEEANADGTYWYYVPLEDLQKVALSANEVDGVLGQAQAVLATSGQSVQELSASLQSNAAVLRGSVKNITVAADATKQLLDVTTQQLNTVSSSLLDVSKQVKSFGTVAQEQLAAANTGLQQTVDSVGKISVSTLGGSLISGLRTYMIITNVLFILAGLGLLAATFQAPLRLKPATSSKAA